MNITIKNYRCINDTFNIELLKKDNNSCLFIASSGKGKTTIFNAINWCLFGDEQIIELKPKKNQKTYVKILFNIKNFNILKIIRNKSTKKLTIKYLDENETKSEKNRESAQNIIIKNLFRDNIYGHCNTSDDIKQIYELWCFSAYCRQKLDGAAKLFSNADKRSNSKILEKFVSEINNIEDIMRCKKVIEYYDKKDEKIKQEIKKNEELISRDIDHICKDKNLYDKYVEFYKFYSKSEIDNYYKIYRYRLDLKNKLKEYVSNYDYDTDVYLETLLIKYIKFEELKKRYKNINIRLTEDDIIDGELCLKHNIKNEKECSLFIENYDLYKNNKEEIDIEMDNWNKYIKKMNKLEELKKKISTKYDNLSFDECNRLLLLIKTKNIKKIKLSPDLLKIPIDILKNINDNYEKLSKIKEILEISKKLKLNIDINKNYNLKNVLLIDEYELKLYIDYYKNKDLILLLYIRDNREYIDEYIKHDNLKIKYEKKIDIIRENIKKYSKNYKILKYLSKNNSYINSVDHKHIDIEQYRDIDVQLSNFSNLSPENIIKNKKIAMENLRLKKQLKKNKLDIENENKIIDKLGDKLVCPCCNNYLKYYDGILYKNIDDSNDDNYKQKDLMEQLEIIKFNKIIRDKINTDIDDICIYSNIEIYDNYNYNIIDNPPNIKEWMEKLYHYSLNNEISDIDLDYLKNKLEKNINKLKIVNNYLENNNIKYDIDKIKKFLNNKMKLPKINYDTSPEILFMKIYEKNFSSIDIELLKYLNILNEINNDVIDYLENKDLYDYKEEELLNRLKIIKLSSIKLLEKPKILKSIDLTIKCPKKYIDLLNYNIHQWKEINELFILKQEIKNYDKELIKKELDRRKIEKEIEELQNITKHIEAVYNYYDIIVEIEKLKKINEEIEKNSTKIYNKRLLLNKTLNILTDIKINIFEYKNNFIKTELQNGLSSVFSDNIMINMTNEKFNDYTIFKILFNINNEDIKLENLSGGQYERFSVLLTCVLGNLLGTPFLLIDEAFSSINSDLKENMIDYLNSLQKPYICVIHDAEEGLFDDISQL